MTETECKVANDEVKLEADGEPVVATPIEEIDEIGDAKAQHPESSGKTEETVREEDDGEPCGVPSLCKMPQQTTGGGGWGSWAASILSNALQLDEEGDGPYTPVENKKDEPGRVIDSQPDFHLPSQNSAIERGATEEDPDGLETQSSSGAYGVSGLGSWGTSWVSGAFFSAKQQVGFSVLLGQQ